MFLKCPHGGTVAWGSLNKHSNVFADHCALMVKANFLLPTVCCSIHLLPAGDATGVWGPAWGDHSGEPQASSPWHLLQQEPAGQREEEAAQRVWETSPCGLPPAFLQHLLRTSTIQSFRIHIFLAVLQHWMCDLMKHFHIEVRSNKGLISGFALVYKQDIWQLNIYGAWKKSVRCYWYCVLNEGYFPFLRW